jgi:hypothetical protein
MVHIIVVIVIILATLCLFLNKLYKRTNAYKNSTLVYADFLIKNDVKKKVLVFGSTYAKYAFDAYRSMRISALNLTLKSQNLNNDLYNLKKYLVNAESDGVAVFVLAPCTLLYTGRKSKVRFYFGNVPGNQGATLKQRMNYFFPLLTQPQKITRFLADERACVDVYDGIPSTVGAQSIEKGMYNLVEVWKNLFSLENLESSTISPSNMRVVEFNSKIIEEMLDICVNSNIRPIILIPPFSTELNKYFSQEFVYKVLLNQVERVCKEYRTTIFFDYRRDQFFQDKPELFLDGGFLLNRRGSQLLIKRLAEDLKTQGIVFTNSTIGI